MNTTTDNAMPDQLHQLDQDESISQRNAILQYLTKLLGMREHASTELLRKAQQKGLDTELTADVLAEFQAAGLQSDQRYLEQLIRSAVAKGKGINAIKATAQQLHVEQGLAEALAVVSPDFFALAAQVAQRKFGVAAQDRKQKQKQMRFLQQRGFEFEQIRYAIERLAATDSEYE